jgi:2-polyprenyl-3-methyl-5-hydroxy-6-metoxy-1,4-benzoquinol methylase
MDHRDNYKIYNTTSSVAETSTDLQKVYRKSYNFWYWYYRQHLPSSLDARILELGSGLGNNLAALRQLGYSQVRGVELCEGSVGTCIENGLDAIHDDIVHYLDNDASKYDVVILHHVLEHFTREEGMALLIQIKKHINPQGILLVAVPNGWNLFGCGGLTNDFTHELIYSRSSLTTMLTMCGYDPHVFSTNMYTSYDPCLFQRSLKTCLLRPLTWICELLIRMVMLSQGLMEKEIRPNLVAVATVADEEPADAV